MDVMRSISLYGLSDVILTFDEGTDDYFARQVVFERLSDVHTAHRASRPAWPRCSAPAASSIATSSKAPTARPQELQTFEDWIIERAYKSVPGVADDSGFGGTTMQYQVLLDPAQEFTTITSPVPQVVTALAANNANTGGGFYSAGRPVLLRARPGPGHQHGRHRRHRRRQQQRRPRPHRDIGEVDHRPRPAPRAISASRKNRRRRRRRHPHAAAASKPRTVLAGVEKKTEELNHGILPPDVKIRPYYDRSDLVRAHHRHRRAQYARRHGSWF